MIFFTDVSNIVIFLACVPESSSYIDFSSRRVFGSSSQVRRHKYDRDLVKVLIQTGVENTLKERSTWWLDRINKLDCVCLLAYLLNCSCNYFLLID